MGNIIAIGDRIYTFDRIDELTYFDTTTYKWVKPPSFGVVPWDKESVSLFVVGTVILASAYNYNGNLPALNTTPHNATQPTCFSTQHTTQHNRYTTHHNATS